MGGSHHYCPLCHGLVQVTIKLLSHPHLCVNKRDEGGDSSSGQEGNFDVWQSQGGGTYLVSHQPTRLPAAANTILRQKAGSGQNLWLHMRIGSRNCRRAELPLYVHTANADRMYEMR